ncbi:hypothetical protein B484DRAFT_401676 [Ochromonadaceae sp. CCMP2298]|nr:hypothetical protein B484DRAFT_401676 [Ochromonadaceae sp. CCMP2298]
MGKGKDSRVKQDKQAKSARGTSKSTPSASSFARGREKEDDEARSLFVQFGISVVDQPVPDAVVSQLSAQSVSDNSRSSHKSRRHNGNRRSPPDRSVTRSQESQGSQGEESTHHSHSESSALEARQTSDRVRKGRISRREMGKDSAPVTLDQELPLDEILEFSEEETESRLPSIHDVIRKKPRTTQSATGSEYELSGGEEVGLQDVGGRSRTGGGMRAVAPQTQFHADFHGKAFALQVSRKLKEPAQVPSGLIDAADIDTSADEENNRRPKAKPSVAVPSPVERQQDPDLIALALAGSDNLWATLLESDAAFLGNGGR